MTAADALKMVVETSHGARDRGHKLFHAVPCDIWQGRDREKVRQAAVLLIKAAALLDEAVKPTTKPAPSKPDPKEELWTPPPPGTF